MQPNISGKIKISQGEVYLPHDKGSGAAPLNRDAANEPKVPAGAYGRMVASKYISRFLNLIPSSSNIPFPRSPGKFAYVFLNLTFYYFLFLVLFSIIVSKKYD